MRFLRRSLVGLFMFAVTIGLLAFAGQSVFQAVQDRLTDAPESRPARERITAANVVMVEAGRVSPVMTVFGEVRSRRTLELRAKAAGTVVTLHPDFEEGGQVAQGDLLLRVDPADAQAALAVARTELAQGETELREATRALDLARDEQAVAEEQAALRDKALNRQRDLKQRGVGTDAAVETAELASAAAKQAVVSRRQAVAQAETRLDNARTGLERARITLSDAQRALEDTELYAAFSGALNDVALIEGGLVANNERVADLIDPRALEVAFRVSTVQFSRLLDEAGGLRPVGVTARLDVFGADLTAQGQISRESGAVAEGQTGRLLFARLDRARGFRPGDFVTVKIHEPPLEHVARLPALAVDAAHTVLALGPENRLEVMQVELLRREGDDVIVRAPDLYGREVVAERSPLLGEGIRIRPLRPGASAAPDSEGMVALTPERRARLLAALDASPALAQEDKARVRVELMKDRVSAATVARLERMGG
ncbi:hypothetical protein C8N32_104180 [Rhodovulum imhoffii]|uniref:Multidrug resistance protein MdtA-like barrel-sandwich hybrid domain-containing protein n=1 Tax=Rhodovulum imhoffii TaxID=365340 RepID=A0A2T5BUC6_9RHOB|nr:efflux transporter periplasmic adaptor subunit [Rhodovulum imhoffii]MBK5934514.1 efflux transporter periplasmic adaptor subunit [Rhodovulum imhoffii]PTN03069.1 hypothetical protein C8N32_104180 [Rhodovulum imhoffii]